MNELFVTLILRTAEHPIMSYRSLKTLSIVLRYYWLEILKKEWHKKSIKLRDLVFKYD